MNMNTIQHLTSPAARAMQLLYLGMIHATKSELANANIMMSDISLKPMYIIRSVHEGQLGRTGRNAYLTNNGHRGTCIMNCLKIPASEINKFMECNAEILVHHELVPIVRELDYIIRHNELELIGLSMVVLMLEQHMCNLDKSINIDKSYKTIV